MRVCRMSSTFSPEFLRFWITLKKMFLISLWALSLFLAKEEKHLYVCYYFTALVIILFLPNVLFILFSSSRPTWSWAEAASQAGARQRGWIPRPGQRRAGPLARPACCGSPSHGGSCWLSGWSAQTRPQTGLRQAESPCSKNQQQRPKPIRHLWMLLLVLLLSKWSYFSLRCLPISGNTQWSPPRWF